MISVVIPVFNEAESLPQLFAELSEVANSQKLDLAIIFVDDGSRDNSWKTICSLAEQHPNVSGILFRRNFGKAAALSAGLEIAQGQLVFTMDADLQDDPHEIPRFLHEIEKGLDVVSGWKQIRQDPWHKVMPSRVFNWMVSRLTGVSLHDHNCGFKCYRREIFNEVFLYGELHRFVPVLAAARGWTVGEIAVNHRPRRFGRSHYGVARFVKGFLDLLTVHFLTGYNQRPQHLLGTVGIASFSVGFLGLMYLSAYWVLAQLFPEWKLTPLHERPAVVYSVGALLLGAQLISMGLLAALVTSFYGRQTKSYSIRDQIGKGVNHDR